MESMEKTLEYHELLMTYADTSKYTKIELPSDFHYEFYRPGDEEEWALIHVRSGEFMSIEQGIKFFHDFYDSFIDELPKRLLFVVNDRGEKVGTATVSLLEDEEYGFDAVIDWFAIKKSYQGFKLAKPMLSKVLELADNLGHKELLLHTQTHTWLAAKLYLDFGFEIFRVPGDDKGWQILKTITNHPKLDDIEAIPQSKMYFETAVKIKEQLISMFGNEFEYSIWHKNGRRDVEVNYRDQLFLFLYNEYEDGSLELVAKS